MLGVMVLLTPLTYFAPEGGWDFGWSKLKFLTQEDFYYPKTQEKTDITDIIAAIDTSMTVVDPLIKHKTRVFN